MGINTPGNLSASKWLGQFTPLGVGSNSGYVGMEFETIQNGGIGGPEQKLHLWTHRNGVLNSRALSIDGIGNVGIGITNPSQKLDVNGSINVSGSIRAGSGTVIYNTSGPFIGCGVGPSQAPSAYNYGIASGCTCLTNNLTTNSTCSYNSFMSGGNNFTDCVYTCNLSPVGRLMAY